MANNPFRLINSSALFDIAAATRIATFFCGSGARAVAW
jgi:hypothetical protein